MTTLAANAPRSYELGDENDVPVIQDIIYEGAAVGDNGSGYGRPLVAGDPFRGFALEKCDNSAGSAGDKRVKVKTKGYIQLAIGSLAITDEGKPVYASDDNTFTLTQSTNTCIGFVKRFVSTGVGVVDFRPNTLAGIAELTDNSAGTANDTIQALADGTTYATDVAAIRNNFADLAAKLNAVIRAIGGN